MKTELRDEYLEYVQARTSWLRRTAYLLSHDWHKADDLVQTAITTLFVKWPQVRKATDIDAYVRKVLVRTFLAEARGRWSKVFLMSGPADTDQPSPAPDVTDRLAFQELLAKLAPRQRAVLVLRFFCDLSVQQTADELGISAGTVKSQTSHGLNALRTIVATPHFGHIAA